MSLELRFVLAALATWRIAFLLAREDGPGDVLTSMRLTLSQRSEHSPLGCVKCIGLLVALPFAPFVGGDWTELVVTWLALSAVTALIDEWTKPPFSWQETSDADELLRGDRHGGGHD